MSQTESESDKNRNEVHINKHSKRAKERARARRLQQCLGGKITGRGRTEEEPQDEQ